MDGNGRWAKSRGLLRTAGHQEGLSRVRELVEESAKLDIQVLTLFAFSSENWSRPKTEVKFLMCLLVKAFEKEGRKLHKNNVRVRVLGDVAALEPKLQKQISALEALTQGNTGLTLQLAINYGSQWEITRATQNIARLVQAQKLAPDDITEDTVANALLSPDVPPVDLFIRTSGEQRISNFMLWQIAYAELYFTPVFFPDFTLTAFSDALRSYAGRERRYGNISE
jgi:undecaprenyl diphosphate synthase